MESTRTHGLAGEAYRQIVREPRVRLAAAGMATAAFLVIGIFG
jgi:hypothetical protein